MKRSSSAFLSIGAALLVAGSVAVVSLNRSRALTGRQFDFLRGQVPITKAVVETGWCSEQNPCAFTKGAVKNIPAVALKREYTYPAEYKAIVAKVRAELGALGATEVTTPRQAKWEIPGGASVVVEKGAVDPKTGILYRDAKFVTVVTTEKRKEGAVGITYRLLRSKLL